MLPILFSAACAASLVSLRADCSPEPWNLEARRKFADQRWTKIRDDDLMKKWFQHIAPMMKMTREGRPDAVPLKMVFHLG